jgi:predicted O-methyltransferase YrrM
MRSDSKLEYCNMLFPEPDALMAEAKKNSDFLQKSAMSVSPAEGNFLRFFVALFQCRNFVEVGTLTGYSALWILQGMKEGLLYTLEKDETHAEKAKQVLEKWKGPARAQVLVGDAVDSLQMLSSEKPFDGIFIDGNKSAYGAYLDWAEDNVKSGGLVIADNVFVGGGVWNQPDGRFSEKQIHVMKEFNRRLSDPKKFESIILPTVEGLFVGRKL